MYLIQSLFYLIIGLNSSMNTFFLKLIDHFLTKIKKPICNFIIISEVYYNSYIIIDHVILNAQNTLYTSARCYLNRNIRIRRIITIKLKAI